MNGLDLNNLGELPAGFLIVVISMACIGIGLLVFFIKKQWIFVREQNGSERVNHERTSEHKNHTNNKDSHIQLPSMENWSVTPPQVYKVSSSY